MAKDLRLDVVTGSDPAGLIEAAAGVDELAKKTDKLGTQMKETTADTFALDAALEAAKLKVDELSQSFADTGQTSILKQINATKRYQSQLQGVQATLAKTGEDVGQAGNELSEFGRLIGSNLNEGDSSLLTFQRAVDNTRAKIKSLQADFRSSGNESIFGDLKKSEADLKSLLSMAGTAGITLTEDGEKAGSNFVSGITESLSSISEYTGPALIGAAAIASPAIGATIATAVTTGFGLGVIGIGALSLKNNPQVKAAVSGLGSSISSEMAISASPLVTPIVQGVGEIENSIEKIGPDLTDMFKAAAPAAKALADGIAGFVTEIGPGFATAMKDAAPAVEALGADLPELGSALGKTLDLMTGTPGIAADVTEAMTALDAAMLAVGGTVRVLGTIWDATLGGALNDTGKTVQTLTLGIDYLDGSLSKHTGQTNVGTIAQDGLNAAIAAAVLGLHAQATALDVVIGKQQEENNMMMAADNATLQYHQALLTFNKELKTGASNWNINTAAGQHQVSNLDSFNAAIQNVYNSDVAVHGATVKNTSAALQSTEALYKQAKAAGASSGELSTMKTEINELKTALADLKSKSITVRLHEIIDKASVSTGAGYRAANELPGHAAGGSYGPGPMLVGERGPEIVVPNGSGTVVPNSALGALGGHVHVTVELTAAAGSFAETALAALRPVIRTRYGSVENALSGVGV